MCGIVGIVDGDGGRVDERALRLMTGALAARGPDGEGFHVSEGVGLGHRRLAIIDVAGGHQPLYSEDGSTALVVNGEIYNFELLRADLQGRGHRFKTRSDSEVIVHGYEQWGDGVIDRLEGMFAVALWDTARRRLLLARDRMGEKPLFWAATARGGLAFASELRALRHAPGVATSIDPNCLARYLVYEYVPAPATMWTGVHKLEPGTRLLWQAGGAPQVERYWSLPLPPSADADRESSPERGAHDLLEALRRSVRQRLVSDVPLGVFLSGGLDSSTVAALAAEARGGDIDTFSIGFDDPSFDESAHARAVAQHIGSRHHEERLSATALLDVIPRLGTLLDEPIGDGSIVPTHLLARFARRHVTVALGGDGGDELFAGYPTFQAERVAALLWDKAPPVVGRAASMLAGVAARVLPASTGYMSPAFKLRQFMRAASAAEGGPPSPERRHQSWLGSFEPHAALAALAPELRQHVGGPLYDVVDRRMAECPAQDARDRLMWFYARGYLGDGVLTKVDRATMAVGLEARAPLLDTGVIALACRIHPSLRLHGMTTKYLLKRAVRGLLPDAIIDRKKQGFAMPVGTWLRGPLRGLLEETLSEPQLRATGLFDPQPIRRLVAEHLGGRADHRKPLWTLLAFMLWNQASTSGARTMA
ncbi:MAG TPA: asparagine synthase (glutamine-hydrolyzing) [Polyangia bacterium]|nr:asparagine synthase (glutamine-hydrolyzing) [Polyangia bacterium]